MHAAQRQRLAGDRWHFQHGPIDLVIAAEGDALAVAAAHEAAWLRFVSVLGELASELPALRRPVDQTGALQGRIAQRMAQACRPYLPTFITPMAAVAGSVAQEIIAAYQRPGIRRAWVNNGGDIALHLAEGESVRVGVFSDLRRFVEQSGVADGMAGGGAGGLSGGADGLALDGALRIHAADGVRGIATSGWRGRSHSLGIADSVTVLAATAAQADAAATMIANAVNCSDERILRRPACELKDDSDLGDRLVTVDVPRLDDQARRAALRGGRQRAQALLDQHLIVAAAMMCQGDWALVGTLAEQPAALVSQ